MRRRFSAVLWHSGMKSRPSFWVWTLVGHLSYAHARVITDLKNMADYYEERTLTEGFQKGENKGKNDCHKTAREARRNDSGLKHQTSLLNILVALNSCVVACLYNRSTQPHSICSLFNSGISLCFVNARLSFYYFKILTNFTCRRIRENVGLARNLVFMWIN